MNQLAPWTLLVALATIRIWMLLPAAPAYAQEAVCLPPTVPPFSALQPVAYRIALFSQQGPTGNLHPIRIRQVRYVDPESREYVFSWYSTPAASPADTGRESQPILLGVDDDPDGPTPAWYDSGAATPNGYVRSEPQQACVWLRFRRGGELQS
jgi:hypothetical protein